MNPLIDLNSIKGNNFLYFSIEFDQFINRIEDRVSPRDRLFRSYNFSFINRIEDHEFSFIYSSEPLLRALELKLFFIYY
jgi:hypothetical protein